MDGGKESEGGDQGGKFAFVSIGFDNQAVCWHVERSTHLSSGISAKRNTRAS